jgi:hypothetical protein
MGGKCARACLHGVYDTEIFVEEHIQYHADEPGFSFSLQQSAEAFNAISSKGEDDRRGPHSGVPVLWTTMYDANTPGQTCRSWTARSTHRSNVGGEFLTSRLFASLSPRDGDRQDATEISYEGEWLDNMKHGIGLLRMHGMTYQGDFEKDKKSGHGVLIWEDGRQYSGQFEDDDFHGSGRMVWPDERQYHGNYVNGKKQGEGTFTWPDGRRYRGQWFEGKRHGVGVYTNAKGVSRNGGWNMDCPVRWETQSKGDENIQRVAAMEEGSFEV